MMTIIIVAHFLRYYYSKPFIILSPFYELTHLIFTVTLSIRYHFADEKTTAQRS